MSKTQEYPKIDRSNFEPNLQKKDCRDQLDLADADGFLNDGRPYRAECWAAYQMTFLTFLMPTSGIENATNEDLKLLLESEGLVTFDDDAFNSSGFGKTNVSSTKKLDASDNKVWEITVIVGDEDGTYIKKNIPLKGY